jgi:branched-subunit amino acid ABC-type transport system permease component
MIRQFGAPQGRDVRSLTEEDEMQFHGIDLEHAWRVAFWVILVLAAVASAAHAIFA